jgi:hypothetical protein
VCQPFALASSEALPTELVLDSTSVYWTDMASGAVAKVGLGGGAVQTLAGGYPGAKPIRLAFGWLYFGTNKGANGGIFRVPLTGGLVTTLALGLTSPWGLTSDGNNLYFTTQTTGAGGGVFKESPAPGPPPTLLVASSNNAGGIVVNGPWVYYTQLGVCPVDGGNCGGSVNRISTDGGLGVVMAFNEPDPTNLVMDSTNLYWVNAAAGSTVISMPITGGSETTIANNQNVPRRVAVDSTSAYWTSNGFNAVLTAPLTGGGTPTTLATNQQAAFGIAVDSTAVYWTTNTSPGTVMKVAKP